MAEAPHGTAPSLMGKDIANPMAMLLACGALLQYAAGKGHDGAERASRAIYERVLETTAGGVGRSTSAATPGTTRVHRRRRREDPHEGRHLVHRSARR